jgi:hypothetical protein
MATASEKAKKVKDSVLDILERFPETRDDDRHLLLRYWSEKDGLAFDYTFPGNFLAATTPESITRARRQIQNAGLFPPSAEASSARREKQAEYRRHFARSGNVAPAVQVQMTIENG